MRPRLQLLNHRAGRPHPRRGPRRPRRRSASRSTTRRVLELLADHGAAGDRAGRAPASPGALVDQALATAPRSFRLYDVLGSETHDFSGDNVHFTPARPPFSCWTRHRRDAQAGPRRTTSGYVKVVSGLANIAAQSTALIPADVTEKIPDSYRLFLSLLYGEKPVVTGAFTIESFEIMHDMQLAVRGSAQALREKPLTIFSCCPTSPLKWSDVTSQNLVDCARPGSRGVHLDAAVGLHGPGHPGGDAGPAHRGDPLRARDRPARQPRARRSCGAARRPSSTCATRPPRWAPSRP